MDRLGEATEDEATITILPLVCNFSSSQTSCVSEASGCPLPDWKERSAKISFSRDGKRFNTSSSRFMEYPREEAFAAVAS